MKPAILDAFEKSRAEWWVWCNHCRKYHSHSPGDGPRECHCGDSTSPYYEAGYIIRHVGAVTKEMEKRQSRALGRKPL
jgi:hypothetical protein